MADDSLAAHTPSPEYMRNLLVRRAIELLGADKATASRIVPEPYKSKYPPSNKLLDAMLTLSLDPVIKPASLKGKLGSMPALDALANQLADKGYFRRYPGGGFGVGGGGGSDGGDPGTSGVGSADIGFDASNTGAAAAAAAASPAVGSPGVVGPGDTPPGYNPMNPGPDFGPQPGTAPSEPNTGLPSVSVSDISNVADDAPASWQRAIDALKGLIGEGPVKGTDIGRLGAFGAGGTSLATRLASMFGGMTGPGGMIGSSLVGGLARMGAGDAASRAATAMAGFGFPSTDTAMMNAVIGGMAGPSGPGDPGGQGQGGGALFGGAVSPGAEITAELTGASKTGGQTAASRTGTPSSALFPGALADMQARGVVTTDNPWALAQSVFPQAQAASPGITLDKLVGEAKKFFEG